MVAEPLFRGLQPPLEIMKSSRECIVTILVVCGPLLTVYYYLDGESIEEFVQSNLVCVDALQMMLEYWFPRSRAEK